MTKPTIKFGCFDKPGAGNTASAEFTVDGVDAGYISREVEDANFNRAVFAKRYVVTGYAVTFWGEGLPDETPFFDTLGKARAYVRATLASLDKKPVIR